MWPVIQAVKELGGSGTIQALLGKVVELEKIPEAVQRVPSTQRRTKLAYHLAWALTKLKKWGALDNDSRSRGVWAINAKGGTLTKDQAQLIPHELAAQYDHENSETQAKPEEGGPALESDVWKDQLLNLLVTNMKPEAFERLAGRILREYGFTDIEVTGKTGDGGIDGVGVLRLDQKLMSVPVCFQCKRYKGSVSAHDVRDFRGALSTRGDRGFFLTTGTFTHEATTEAAKNPTIDLIDGDRLCDLLKQHELGIKILVDSPWFDTI